MPTNVIFCMALLIYIVFVASLVMFAENVMLFSAVHELKFVDISWVTPVKLTNSSNDVITVFPLNCVPMEYHRNNVLW